MPIAKTITDKRKQILQISRQYGVSNIRVFGSMVRNDAADGSDIDFLVDLAPDRDLFDLGALLMDMQELFNKKVDIVTEKALHNRRIREQILGEAIPL